MDFVIEVRADQNPPDRTVLAASVMVILNTFRQFVVSHVTDKLGSPLPHLHQLRDECVVLIASYNGHFPRIAGDDFDAWISEFAEQPFVGVNQVLGQVCNTHGFGRDPPILHSFRNDAKALQRRLSHGERKLGQALLLSRIVHVGLYRRWAVW